MRIILPRFSRRHLLAGVSVFALSLSPILSANANADRLPNDPTVQHGHIEFRPNNLPGGNKQLIIDQTTNKGVIDWAGFSIADGNQVNFNQPSANAISVNRVTGSDPSAILGQLSANGQIVLSNPNGILFGPNANVDVAGLIATTGWIDDTDLTDFMDQDQIHKIG